MNSENEFRCQVYLEVYKIVSNEILLYVKEIIKCFSYLAVLIALYLGLGIKEDSTIANEIRNYIPYGCIILAIYFLSLSYIRLSLTMYRASIESRIKETIDPTFMGLESDYINKIQRFGFIRLDKQKFMFIPTPMLFLGIAFIFIIYLVLKGQLVGKDVTLTTIFFVFCVLLTLYVFFLFPLFAKKILNVNKTENNTDDL